jgi:hypothetical protein
MSLIKRLVRSLSAGLDGWLSRIGEENRPKPHPFDHLSDDIPLLTEHDRIGDEKG